MNDSFNGEIHMIILNNHSLSFPILETSANTARDLKLFTNVQLIQPTPSLLTKWRRKAILMKRSFCFR